MSLFVFALAVLCSLVDGAAIGGRSDRYGPKYLYDSADDGHHYVTFNYGSQGVYKFAFKLPDQAREEERNADGEVRGSYSFTDPEGEEFSLQYLADKRGFQPTADHLPVAPEDTDDVKKAREAFQQFYEETVRHLESISSDEDSSEENGSYRSSPRGYGRSFTDVADGQYRGDTAFESRKIGDIDGDDDDDDDDDDDSSSSESDEDDDDSSEEDGDDSSSEEDDEDESGDDEEEKGDENEGDENEHRENANEEENENEIEKEKEETEIEEQEKTDGETGLKNEREIKNETGGNAPKERETNFDQKNVGGRKPENHRRKSARFSRKFSRTDSKSKRGYGKYIP